MSVETNEGRVVHLPANPEKFEFDGEVARVFPDMATRSIPLFHETHALHALLCQETFDQGHTKVMDIGASRGHFLRALSRHYPLPQMDVTACDYSYAMVEYLRRDFPSVAVAHTDITSRDFLTCRRTYDVINLAYVLQFIPIGMQRVVLAKVVNMLRPGGILFFGAKVDIPGELGRRLHDQYIQWRLGNGYTKAEIEAKTKALANSMWTREEQPLLQDLKDFGITSVARTTAHTVFSNFMCIK